MEKALPNRVPQKLEKARSTYYEMMGSKKSEYFTEYSSFADYLNSLAFFPKRK